jgi:hypothetical protein
MKSFAPEKDSLYFRRYGLNKQEIERHLAQTWKVRLIHSASGTGCRSVKLLSNLHYTIWEI